MRKAAGAILLVVAVYTATITLRETFTQINLAGFVRTEFIVSGNEDGRLNGRVAAGGEEFRGVRIDGARRVPVWYWKGTETWRTVDRVLPFRLQSVEEFGAHSYPLLLGGNLLIAALAVFLLRRVSYTG